MSISTSAHAAAISILTFDFDAPSSFRWGWLMIMLLVVGCDRSERGHKSADQTYNQSTQVPSSDRRDLSKGSIQMQTDQESNAAAFVESATQLLEQQEIEKGWQTIQRGLIRYPSDAELLFLAARVLAFQSKLREAIALLDKIPIDHPEAGLPALGQGAEWALQLGDLRTAEARLLQILRRSPGPSIRPMIARMLTQIYNVQGRRWEAGRQVMELVRLGDFSERELMMLVNLREPFQDAEVHRLAEAFDADDPFLQLGKARFLIFQSKFSEALNVLENTRTRLPQSLEPWVWLGTCLVHLERFDDLPQWHRAAPTGYESHPQYWTVMGQWALHETRLESAVRCYVEAIRRDPRSILDHQELGECLTQLGRENQAAQVRERAAKLIEIAGIVPKIATKDHPIEVMHRVAQLYQELDEAMLSWSWKAVAEFAANRQPSREILDNLKLSRTPAETSPSFLDGYATEEGTIAKEGSERSETEQLVQLQSSPHANAGYPIRFVEVRSEVGVEFQFVHSGKRSGGLNIYEGIGGGCSALDFDRDGYCDLYFSQAGAAPTATAGFLPKQLFRSIQGQRFVNVSQQATIMDLGYGQGLAVADYDQDGFGDLAVANFGGVRLYRNMGDGTFEQTSSILSRVLEEWVSAITLGDINGDALPDLIVGGYCLGPEYLTRDCPSPKVDAITCHPRNFPPCPNHTYLNLGTGEWERMSNSISSSVADGYTLGVLIANIDQRDGNDIFYANDNSPNFLLLSQVDANGHWSLQERGSRSGVAVSGSGRAQACMGIAMGDINRDGRFDLVVTNFRNDVNTAYMQSAPGTFFDGTRKVGLHKDTWEWLGFGCQLLDLDLDGWLDFAVVNGHIDNYLRQGDPYYMPAQIFRSLRGSFYWLKDLESPGSYFEREHLGRGLVQADLNRDGLVDLIATHLEEPASLLMNTTATSNRFLQMELIGVTADRDAVGAVVEIKAGNETWILSRSNGDGFYGSNENMLHIGVGKNDFVDSIRIRWPDGRWQTLGKLETNQRLMIVQDQELVTWKY